MDNEPTIVWFRRDMRLRDNGALFEASERGAPILPVYIDDREEAGGASKWWRHHSLAALSKDLGKHRSRLIIRRGDPLKELRRLIEESGAVRVFWNRLYEPRTIPRDKQIKETLEEDGLEVRSFPGYLLFEPHQVSNKQGAPYKVFTPFWREICSRDVPPQPLPLPTLRTMKKWPESLALSDLNLLPGIDWAAGLRKAWKPGEEGAHEHFMQFIQQGLGEYDEMRDRPDIPGTSRLSPHLHFGEITPRTIWHQVQRHILANLNQKKSSNAFLRQVGWREFSHHLLYHFPHTVDKPLRKEFSAFPWSSSKKQLKAWQAGQTGYPIVDAGMRELWETGWMHNRVRMIVASFLVKDLMVRWQRGAEWFWDTLVDADLANNTMGWQWTAGCGADAAPYFRIFNPVLQGKRFDPDGAYIRRWVPEIASLPNKHLHAPWEAPKEVLKKAALELDRDYPRPIVNHQEARDEALAAYNRIKKNR